VSEEHKCPKCGQSDVGQQGEYPCPVCSLPTAWGNVPKDEYERELPCINKRCEVWLNDPEIGNCDGATEGGDPAILECPRFIADTEQNVKALHLEQRCDLRETCGFLKEARDERDMAIAKAAEWKPVLAEWSKRVAELTVQLAALEKEDAILRGLATRTVICGACGKVYHYIPGVDEKEKEVHGLDKCSLREE
jgi:hypothetical protein